MPICTAKHQQDLRQHDENSMLARDDQFSLAARPFRSVPLRPRITISVNAPNENSDQDLVTLDLPPGLTIADLKAFVQAETNFPTTAQHFYLNGQPLSSDAQTIEDAGIKDGEMLAMLINRGGSATGGQNNQARSSRQRNSRPDQRRRNEPDADEVETTRLRILGHPGSVAALREQKPDLAAVLNDPVRFREKWTSMVREEEDRERERQNQIALLNEDPFNVEAQKKIEEMIRQDRVMENLQHAYENNPEVFARVTMLYINAEVNGHAVKAFVDSGAQTTIMSPSCAEACGIMRLIDTRYSGIAKGVGTAKILGRVHSAEIKIGDAVMPCAFTVMEGKDVDLLFGLDMLKRYQACIDLRRNKLVFQGHEVPFLPEGEIPRQLEEAALSEPTVAGPNGTKIGAKSGTVRPAGSSSSSAAAAAEGSSQGNFKGVGQMVGPPPAGSTTGSSQAQQQAGSGNGAPVPPAAPSFPQASIQQLVGLGFSEQEAIAALSATGGNVEYAAGLLFNN